MKLQISLDVFLFELAGIVDISDLTLRLFFPVSSDTSSGWWTRASHVAMCL